MSTFSERLKELKDESGLLLKDLQEATGITVPNLSYYMKGREPSYEVLVKIAEYFNVTTDYLVGKSDQRNYADEALAQSIQLNSGTNAINNKRQGDIQNRSVKLHDILVKLADVELKKKVDDVWDMVDLWLDGLEMYVQYVDQYIAPSYPLDIAKDAMNAISGAESLAAKRVGDMLAEIVKSETVDKSIKDRVVMRSSFGIKSQKSVEENSEDTAKDNSDT